MTLSFLIQMIILPFILKNFGIWQIGVVLLGGLLNFPVSVVYLTGLFCFYTFLVFGLIKNVFFPEITLLNELIEKSFEF